MNVLEWFAVLANILTVVAGFIAIAGVVWELVARARLSVRIDYRTRSIESGLVFAITSIGANPVKAIRITMGAIDDDGFSIQGGEVAGHAVLDRDDVIQIEVFESSETITPIELRKDQYVRSLLPGHGAFLRLQFQSPFLPWRRASRTYVWPPCKRYARELPVSISGLRERAFLTQTRCPSELKRPICVPGPKRVRPVKAEEHTFEELVAEHPGLVLVGVGMSWQDDLWRNVQYVLDAFAIKYEERVLVLTVNADEEPAIASRFGVDHFPTLMLLEQGKVVRLHVGAATMPELERAFGPYLEESLRARRRLKLPQLRASRVS